jgi:hypothetical protein
VRCEKSREAEEKEKGIKDDEIIAVTDVLIDLFFASYTRS